MDEALRQELTAMREEDQRVRQELVESGELGGHYVPLMEAVHRRNAERLNEIVDQYGWPDVPAVGPDGAEAAWLIAQHAIGFPDLQRKYFLLLQRSAEAGSIPRWHAAYLEDRIAMYEGRPQRYGTQWLDDPRDGQIRPWKLENRSWVNEWRAEAGLGPLHPIPEPGPDLPPAQQSAIRENQQWWEAWLAGRGWRSAK